jgi:signal transduction histidine kinase
MIPAQPKPSDSGYLSLFQEVTRLITSTLNVDKVLETIAAKIKNKQLEITISPVSVFDSDGKTDFVIGTIQDITAHIRLQEEQRIRERLQGVLEMSGAAVHELNTPIFAALGTAQMLLKDLAPTDDHCVSGVIVRTSGVMISPTRIDLAF